MFLKGEFSTRLVQVSLFSAIVYYITAYPVVFESARKYFPIKFKKTHHLLIFHTFVFAVLMYVLTYFVFDPIVRVVEGKDDGGENNGENNKVNGNCERQKDMNDGDFNDITNYPELKFLSGRTYTSCPAAVEKDEKGKESWPHIINEECGGETIQYKCGTPENAGFWRFNSEHKQIKCSPDIIAQDPDEICFEPPKETDTIKEATTSAICGPPTTLGYDGPPNSPDCL
tara:strand:+ start:269 stop:952 length:684 start_codon:yes stop_codon:yes gene_type:complete